MSANLRQRRRGSIPPIRDLHPLATIGLRERLRRRGAASWLAAAAGCLALIGDGAPALAAFPGGNGKIAFSSNRDGDYEIYTMNADGGDVTQLTFAAAADRDPSWSPDGQRIAFHSDRDGDNEIYVIDADGSGVVKVTDNTTDDREPSWSPASQQLAFTKQASTSGRTEVYTVNLDGTGQAAVTGHTCDRFSICGSARPSWSNVDEIAFTEYGDFDNNILVREPNGTFVRSYGTAVDGEDDSNWSPSAAKIAFSFATGGGQYGIRTLNSNGTGQFDVDVQSSPVVDNRPAWSPDGTKILFGRYTAGSAPVPSEVWLVNADGAGDTNLTNDAADDVEPDWQPLVETLLAPYPRPIGAAKSTFTLVPAFKRCVSPNTGHGAPLDKGSCAPSQPEGTTPTRLPLLAFPNDDSTRGNGSVVIRLVPGNLATQVDEADVSFTATANDVRCIDLESWGVDPPPCGASNSTGGPDYTGKLLASTTLRITDPFNGFGRVSATTADEPLSVPMQCTSNSDPAVGSTCSVTTTADSLYGESAAVSEGKRTVWELGQPEIRDPGPDNYGFDFGCPPTCGNGDEATFLRGGIFVP